LKSEIPSYIVFLISFLFTALTGFAQGSPAIWQGVLRDQNGTALVGASVELQDLAEGKQFTSTTDSNGLFAFNDLPAGKYSGFVRWQGKSASIAGLVAVREGRKVHEVLEVAAGWTQVVVRRLTQDDIQASGGERLSSREVSGLPLNKRDLSQLLLLAAGTMTDSNGAANFTEQFAVNGQRGSTAVFAMDGTDITDPEIGGATFSSFNVDAIQELQSSSGVMSAEIGHGASAYTNIATKSGARQIHGTVFEFARQAAFDARNFFDRRSVANPGRIPPFVRNEFGITNGGPVVLPGIYNGRNRTFYFGEYQGFRQVLGTTQILSLPTAAERQGIDTATFPGDTLLVPVNPQIAQVLARYPLPNDPQGPYGPRTYATSSKVSTFSDQFSVRIDHRISAKAQFYARFSLNQVNGPLTNPDQTAIDPSFAIRFYDHQRSAGLKYTRTVSVNFTSETTLGFIRSTPVFPTINHAQPGLKFGDGLYEAFNGPAGGVFGAFGNVFQLRQDFAYVHRSHSIKTGVEIRCNRDSAIYGTAPNGEYTFGGGTAYSQVEIPSRSGRHDIRVGDPLPDALTGFLTATPFAYQITAASPFAAQGDRFDEVGIGRQSYNFYIQDAWKISPRWMVNYGLRYELNTRIREPYRRTSNPVLVGPAGQPARFWDPGVWQNILVNPQPPYRMDWGGWGPRLAIEWRATDRTVLRAGGAITTRLPSGQDNAITGGLPYFVNPYVSALPGVPIPFQNTVAHFDLPIAYTPQGQEVFATGRTSDVPPNTPMDVQRFQTDLAAVTPGHQVQALSVFGMLPDFSNGYIETYTAGLEHDFGQVQLNLSYVATAGVKLASLMYPNSYGGAGPAFAPLTRFDASGQVAGGFGPEFLVSSRSHSTYHALQIGAQKTSTRWGVGFQASYSFSKSLDDTSSVFGSSGGSSGTVLQALAQNPWNPGAEKGPSTFDTTHVFSLSLIQDLPLNRISWLRPMGGKLTSGWQFLNITTFASGSPFSVFSGIQQTGAGSAGGDRPDQIGTPDFSTSRKVREDYFGRGINNSSFFDIPIGIPGGTGPNQGRFGCLGRNTFRGPAFHNFDVALIKDTSFGRRGGREAFTLQFRAEFFNVFNLVNLGLPSNIVRGSGFGIINRTAGSSRQIQFSLKLFY
jgi:hypothetical protein